MDRAHRTGQAVLAAARARMPAVSQHRALRHMQATTWVLCQMALLPLLFSAGVWAARFHLFAAWRACTLWWADRLGLPLIANPQHLPGDALGLSWTAHAGWGQPPTGLSLWVVAGATLLTLLASGLLRGHATPLRYLVRVLCGIQALSVLYFAALPGEFPYPVDRHAHDLASTGFVTMLAVPVLLALGYGVVTVSLVRKLAFTALVLGYFALYVPHQLVLHLLVLHHLGTVFMPLLFMAFGALFNMLVFVALYAWTASLTIANTPPSPSGAMEVGVGVGQ